MSGVPYIGAKISLISRSEIRYEGILAEVDPKESTIGLENVMMMGTENRKAAHEFVPLNPQIYDFILFRSTDIKDLQVCEAPAAPQPVQHQQQYYDPAIVSHQQHQQQYMQPPKLQFGTGRSPVVEASYSQPISQASPSLKFGSGPSFVEQRSAVQQQQPQQKPVQQEYHEPKQAPVSSSKVHPSVANNVVSLTPKADQKPEINVKSEAPAKVLTYSTGTKKQEMVEDRGQFSAPPQRGSYASIASHGATSGPKVSLERPGKFRAPAQPPTQFNNQFSMTKSTELAQGKLSEAQEEVFRQLAGGNFYEKSSFFDNISCDAKDGKDGKDAFRNERNLNMETFGVAAPPSSNYRGRGRGGYRGDSRGGYRGGSSRGGYQRGGYSGGRGDYRGGHNQNNGQRPTEA